MAQPQGNKQHNGVAETLQSARGQAGRDEVQDLGWRCIAGEEASDKLGCGPRSDLAGARLRICHVHAQKHKRIFLACHTIASVATVETTRAEALTPNPVIRGSLLLSLTNRGPTKFRLRAVSSPWPTSKNVNDRRPLPFAGNPTEDPGCSAPKLRATRTPQAHVARPSQNCPQHGEASEPWCFARSS